MIPEYEYEVDDNEESSDRDLVEILEDGWNSYDEDPFRDPMDD